MSRFKKLTLNVSVVQPLDALQDSIGVTRQRQYIEQGEIGTQTSCLELQWYKNYITQFLTYDDTILFNNHVLHANPPELQPSTYLEKTQKP